MLLNLTRDLVLARHVRIATGFGARLLGLLGRQALNPEEALVIVPCNSVHTFFMRFPIDVAFLDHHWQVLHLVHNLRPFRWTPVIRGARYAVELPAYRLRETDCQKGDVLRLVGVTD